VENQINNESATTPNGFTDRLTFADKSNPDLQETPHRFFAKPVTGAFFDQRASEPRYSDSGSHGPFTRNTLPLFWKVIGRRENLMKSQKLSKPDALIKGNRCSAWLLLIDGMPNLRAIGGAK
jgi:hypothetical protein